MEIERYLLDAVERVLHEVDVDALDEVLLSSTVVSMAAYLAHQGQD